MDRRIEPEFLDQLPANDPRAIRSRRDLQWLNAWMQNAQIMARSLHCSFPDKPPPRILEIGAGDGTFLLRVARRLGPEWRGTTALLLDRQQVVTPETLSSFKMIGWQVEPLKADVFEWLQAATPKNCDAIIANLFLHHFSDSQLSALLRYVAHQAPVFVAMEPRRWNWSLWCCKLLCLVSCNDITRHDASVSIRAGFAGTELSTLWPKVALSIPPDGGWSLRETPANFSSHLFVAQRKRDPHSRTGQLSTLDG